MATDYPNLKVIRKAKNMTQQELADKLNVSRSTVAMWETGMNTPPTKILIKLADALDVSIFRIIGPTSYAEHIITIDHKKGVFPMTLNALLATINTNTLTIRVPVSNNLIAQISVRVGCSSEVDDLSMLYGERTVKNIDTDPHNSGRLIVDLK